jgi:hypothetical protein
MPIREFFGGRSFDPETIDLMNAAFVKVCDDLGLRDKTDGTTEIVAEYVIKLTDGQRDPEVIRKAVLAAIRAKGE